MINYATKLNQPWDGIERLFIDSGGYSFMIGAGDYETSDTEYLDYINAVAPEKFALRDYPCEPEIRAQYGRTVADHQQLTTRRHCSLLTLYEDQNIDADPVAVIQGYHAHEYAEHIDSLREHGLLTDTVAVGTLCGREDRQQIRQILSTAKSELPPDTSIHAFGVKLNALYDPTIRDLIDTADSNAFDFDERKVRTRNGGRGRTFRDVAFYYLKHKRKIESLIADDVEPTDLRDSNQLGLEEIA